MQMNRVTAKIRATKHAAEMFSGLANMSKMDTFGLKLGKQTTPLIM